MKKKVFNHLLFIAGVVLLVGLIASCGESPEPQYKLIASEPYLEENYEEVWNELWNKHISGRTQLGGCDKGVAIMGQANWRIMWDDLIKPEWAKKPSTVDELCMVLKVDVYRVIGRVFAGDGDMYINGYIYYN
jgi:hypothetical protein